MKMIKGISSKQIFKEYPSNRHVFRKLWSRGYRAFEVKEMDNLERTAAYINEQKLNNIDKRFLPNWKPRRLVAGFLILSMLIFLSSCAPAAEKASEPLISTSTEEAVEIEPPKREMVSSYEDLKGGAKEPKLECKVVAIKNISPEKAVETISRAIPNIIAVKNDDSDSIIIRGEPEDLKEAQKIIDTLDKKIPQIFIEGKVVEVSERIVGHRHYLGERAGEL
jgi:hypothetical protein